MAITQAMTTSFKVEMLQGVHNFTNGSGGGSANTGATFKIALYTSSATLGAATTAFTTTNEASGTAYTSGGNTLTNVTPTNGCSTNGNIKIYAYNYNILNIKSGQASLMYPY